MQHFNKLCIEVIGGELAWVYTDNTKDEAEVKGWYWIGTHYVDKIETRGHV